MTRSILVADEVDAGISEALLCSARGCGSPGHPVTTRELGRLWVCAAHEHVLRAEGEIIDDPALVRIVTRSAADRGGPATALLGGGAARGAPGAILSPGPILSLTDDPECPAATDATGDQPPATAKPDGAERDDADASSGEGAAAGPGAADPSGGSEPDLSVPEHASCDERGAADGLSIVAGDPAPTAALDEGGPGPTPPPEVRMSCRIPECGAKARSLRLCSQHYQTLYRRCGRDIAVMRSLSEEEIDRRLTWPGLTKGTKPTTAPTTERDSIAELLGHLADQASRIPLGDAYRDGPLAGASRYNVAIHAIRGIVTWDHHRKGPKGADCSACGKLRACTPHGVAGYPLCLECYTRGALDLAQGYTEDGDRRSS